MYLKNFAIAEIGQEQEKFRDRSGTTSEKFSAVIGLSPPWPFRVAAEIATRGVKALACMPTTCGAPFLANWQFLPATKSLNTY